MSAYAYLSNALDIIYEVPNKSKGDFKLLTFREILFNLQLRANV